MYLDTELDIMTSFIIYEVEYSVSPGGVDRWEIAYEHGGDFCAGDFETARAAFDYLVDHFPADKLLSVEVHSLEWARSEGYL